MKQQDSDTQPSQSLRTLNDWLDYFESLHSKTIDLGLERIAQVAQKGNLKHLPGKVILVAGTNGKGTTSAFIENILLKLGFTTGVFSSPHILQYNECVRVNGKELADELHVAAFAYIEQQRQNISLTPFEFSTLAAFKLIKDANVDFSIIEVGMGGRGDSTNIVELDISVITTIDIDHQAFLGNDRQTIGYEKAGVMRGGKPTVIGELDIPSTVMQYAEEVDANTYLAQVDFCYEQTGKSWHWQSEKCQLTDLPIPNIPMQNVATGLKVLQLLDITVSRQLMADVLQTLVVPGRFEQISSAPKVIVDVAHNVEAARYLGTKLKHCKQQGAKQIIAVCGMFKDKDIAGTLAQVMPFVDTWMPASIPTKRGADAQLIYEALEKQGICPHKCYDNVLSALNEAKQCWREGDVIVVFGSFVTVAQILQVKKL